MCEVFQSQYVGLRDDGQITIVTNHHEKTKSKQTIDNSKKHDRSPRAGFATHGILKTHSSSQKILLTETQRSLRRVHTGVYSVLYG